MKKCTRLLIACVALAAALTVVAPSAALADTAVSVSNPGTFELTSPSTQLKVSGVTALDCNEVIVADIDAAGVASNVSFTLTPGTANCAFLYATSTGGKLCQDTSGNTYLQTQITRTSGAMPPGSLIGSGTIRGGVNATGDTLDFVNSPIVGLGTVSLNGTYTVTSPSPQDAINYSATSNPC